MTKREQVLTALHVLLMNALTAPVLRNEVLPEKIVPEGLCVLRDGDPGEPEVTLSPENYLYEHRAELDVVVAHADSAARDALFDSLLAAIGTAIASDRTLGGLCDLVRALAPEPVTQPVEGAAALKAATVPIILVYATDDPLA